MEYQPITDIHEDTAEILSQLSSDGSDDYYAYFPHLTMFQYDENTHVLINETN